MVVVTKAANYFTEHPVTMGLLPCTKLEVHVSAEDIGLILGGNGPAWRKLRAKMIKSFSEATPRQ
jgi:hypothetical protein